MTDLTQETTIALISKDIVNINKNVDEIRLDIKNLSGVYVPSVKYEDDKKAFDLRIVALEKQNRLWAWLSPTLTALIIGTLGPVLTILVLNYLNKLR